jgi:hypothetical protein
MRWHYACPKCGATLNPREDVVLIAARERIKVLLQFHPRPGDYQLHKPDDLELVPGDAWNFFCPVCRENLAVEGNEGFCAIDQRAEGRRRRVVFSRVAGERATFIFSSSGLEEHHGVDASDYLQFMERTKWLI